MVEEGGGGGEEAEEDIRNDGGREAIKAAFVLHFHALQRNSPQIECGCRELGRVVE